MFAQIKYFEKNDSVPNLKRRTVVPVEPTSFFKASSFIIFLSAELKAIFINDIILFTLFSLSIKLFNVFN